MIGPALLLALQVAGPPSPASYEVLVKEGVALAHRGDHAGAEHVLQQARALLPSRPEALVELAGLRFLDGRYAEAVALLRPALRHGAGDLALDLMATSLHLSGRTDDALEAWNRLRRPVLRNVRVLGVFDTRARLLVPQIALVEGALLTRSQVRETRLRLEETGAFERVRVRPVPLGGSEADVELVVSERHGLGAPAQLAAVSLAKALQRTAWLRYENAGGTGIALGASYRWRSTERLATASLAWPRPFGLDATLLAEGSWQRQAYDFNGQGLRLEARWAELGLRRVLGSRTVAEARWRGGRRTFEGSSLDPARPGRVSGLTLQVERRLAEAWRHRLDATATVFGAGALLGSELDFAVARLALRETLFLSAPEHTTIERSVLAVQVVAGGGTSRAPLDTFFVPGASSEMTLPLRAHRHRREGVLGRSPVGRSIGLVNLEWRRRILRSGPLQAGVVLFYDGARIGRLAGGESGVSRHDLGLGLRLGVLGMVARLDCATSLNGDSNRALTAGLGQAF